MSKRTLRPKPPHSITFSSCPPAIAVSFVHSLISSAIGTTNDCDPIRGTLERESDEPFTIKRQETVAPLSSGNQPVGWSVSRSGVQQLTANSLSNRERQRWELGEGGLLVAKLEWGHSKTTILAAYILASVHSVQILSTTPHPLSLFAFPISCFPTIPSSHW